MAVGGSEVTKIIQHHEALAGKRRHWEIHWQEVSDHSLGRRDFTTIREPGRQRAVRLYDTTSRDANTLLAAALHALLTNTATNWFDMRFENPDLNEDDEALRWLAVVKDRMSQMFTREESAFSTNMHEFYSDLVGFCTAALYIDSDEGFGPKFSARPLGEIYIDEDASGHIVIVQRKFKLKNWQAVDQWGDKAKRASERSKERGGGEEEMEYLHVVRRRGKPIPGNIDASGMAWESIYISLQDKTAVDEGGYHENPYIVARWSKDSGELYGRGPGIDSLADQKMLNSIWRTYIRNAEKQADPPLMMEDEGVLPGSQVRIVPTAVIHVRNDNPNGPPLQYLEHRGRFEVSNDVIASRTQRIEKAHHSEIIQAFQDPRMTATQVLELARLSQRLLSPVLSRMQIEALGPMLTRVYGIGSRRRGFFPEAPAHIQGQDIAIEYVSPIARAQQQSEVQAIVDSISAAAGIAQMSPGVIDNIDMDEAIRQIFAGNGAPIEVLRRKREVEQIRDERSRQQEAQEQLDQMSQMAEAGGRVAPLVGELQAVAGQ